MRKILFYLFFAICFCSCSNQKEVVKKKTSVSSLQHIQTKEEKMKLLFLKIMNKKEVLD